MENWKVPAENSSQMWKRKLNEEIVKNSKIKLEPAETNSSICQLSDTMLNFVHPTVSEERGINNSEERVISINLVVPISLDKTLNPIPAAVLEEERMDTLEERMNNLEERMKAIPVSLSSIVAPIHPGCVKEERMDTIPVTSDQTFNFFPQSVLEEGRIDPKRISVPFSVSSVHPTIEEEIKVDTFQDSNDAIRASSNKTSNPVPTAVLEEERRNGFVEKLDAMLISLNSIPPTCIKEEKIDFMQEKNDAISSHETLNPVPAVDLKEEILSPFEESINKIPVCFSSIHPVCIEEEKMEFFQERNDASPVPFDQTLDPVPLASLKKEQIDTSHDSRDPISVFSDQATRFVPPFYLKQERMDSLDSNEKISAFKPVFSSELAPIEQETEINTTYASTEPTTDLNLSYYSELAAYIDPRCDIEQIICSQTLNFMAEKLKDFETKELASQDILKDIDVVIRNIALSSEISKISETDSAEKFVNSDLQNILNCVADLPQPQLSSINNANDDTNEGPEVIQID